MGRHSAPRRRDDELGGEPALRTVGGAAVYAPDDIERAGRVEARFDDLAYPWLPIPQAERPVLTVATDVRLQQEGLRTVQRFAIGRELGVEARTWATELSTAAVAAHEALILAPLVGNAQPPPSS